jgi:hypothetical protein
MKTFPDFMKNSKNRVNASHQNTDDIEGYYFQGAADTKRKIRLIIKLVVIALILAGASLFILKDKSGRPSKSDESREYTEMYKYKDANGILHYTDIKPKNTEYEVLYMPVSKDKPPVEKTVDKLIGKFRKEKKKEEESQINASADEKASEASGKPSGQEDPIKEAKETLQKVADLYKDAPEAINEAKKVKQQVEKIYQEREKAMKEMR